MHVSLEWIIFLVLSLLLFCSCNYKISVAFFLLFVFLCSASWFDLRCAQILVCFIARLFVFSHCMCKCFVSTLVCNDNMHAFIFCLTKSLTFTVCYFLQVNAGATSSIYGSCLPFLVPVFALLFFTCIVLFNLPSVWLSCKEKRFV